MRLDGYIRVSKVNGREGESFISPSVQRERIESFASLNGHEVVNWHEDMDVSGAKDERDGLNAALMRLENGETQGIAVAKLDRFSRSLPGALKLIARIHAAGGELVCVEPNIDTSGPAGKFMQNVFLAMNEFYLDTIRETWDSAVSHAVARGAHFSSRVPLGYTRNGGGKLQVDPETAPIVRELFRRRAQGATWGELLFYVNAKTGRSWTHGALPQMLKNRVYLGEARIGKHHNPDAHEPLVTTAAFMAAQGKSPAPTARRHEPLLLQGLVRCASCRYLCKPEATNHRYGCRRFHKGGECPSPITIKDELLDEYVVQEFLSAFESGGPLATAATRTVDLEAATAAVEDAERELKTYLAAVSADLVGVEAFRAGAEERKARLDKAQAHLQELRSQTEPAVLALGRHSWDDLDLRERNELLKAAIGAIMVKPGSGRRTSPDGLSSSVEERVRILWRGEEPDDLPARGRSVEFKSFLF